MASGGFCIKHILSMDVLNKFKKTITVVLDLELVRNPKFPSGFSNLESKPQIETNPSRILFTLCELLK